MSILLELTALLSSILPIETGVFSGVPPDEYIVLTPMTDLFDLFGDDEPHFDISEVRVSLFSKHNYIKRKKQITAALLGADFTITGRRYIGYENDSGFHHFCYDVVKEYYIDDSYWD